MDVDNDDGIIAQHANAQSTHDMNTIDMIIPS